jgi:hypothetical protein
VCRRGASETTSNPTVARRDVARARRRRRARRAPARRRPAPRSRGRRARRDAFDRSIELGTRARATTRPGSSSDGDRDAGDRASATKDDDARRRASIGIERVATTATTRGRI